MDRIGEYLVKRLIGEGGMGKVYEAEERLSGRRVALKVLRSELMRSEEGRKLFLSEMQILAHLEHASLVRSLASMEVDGQLVLVLEYLRGRTLRQELGRAGALPWTDACEYVVRIADALSVAHEQSPPIVHRDLKPENVMLVVKEGEDEGTGEAAGIKVMDFGVAKVLEAANATNTQSIGTLAYMSPEQIDARSIDARSDLYALGLIFYEMIAGVPPFRSTSPRELLNLQCTATPPALSAEVRRGLPKGVEDLLFALLEKDPEKRPADAHTVSERLAPFCAAGASLGTSAPRAVSGARDKTDSKKVTPAPNEKTEKAEKIDASESADKGGKTEERETEKAETPRLDTIALIEKKTEKKEVPAWLAISAIVGLSIAAFATTYLVRTKMAEGPSTPRDVVTAVASPR
jgi:serine/threonine-protein kinase